MHVLSTFRIRIIIFLMVLLILWQIFRTWPDGSSFQVSWRNDIQYLFSRTFKCYFCDSTFVQEEQFAKTAGAPVLVMVFYEAMCPDSKHFIMKQLQSAFYRAPSLVDFQLVPYGKASVSHSPKQQAFFNPNTQNMCALITLTFVIYTHQT